MRIPLDVWTLATDYGLEYRLDDVGRNVRRGGVERSSSERFATSQQGSDIGKRNRRHEALRRPEGIY
jgi:hypothetical protein